MLPLTMLPGCRWSPPTPDNLVLISVDTLRADHLGCYGHRDARTPRIDGLAARGLLAEDVSAPAPLTAPSHATILTGRYPPEHGVRSNGFFRLPEEQRTLAEILRETGLDTHAVVGGFPLSERFGFGQGFSTFDDHFGLDEGGNEPERSAEAVVDAALEVLATKTPGERFFLFLHFYDPHADYTPPAGFDSLPPYDGEIAYVDREIGRLLDTMAAAGLAERTAVAVVADHGESLGEHGETTHAVFVYQAVLRVPFLLAGPGIAPGTRITAPSTLADVAPTLLQLMGIPATGMAGRSLLGAVPPDRGIYFESQLPQVEFGWAPLSGLRRGPYKLIVAPRPELYRVDQDPREERDLSSLETGKAKGLRDELDALARERWPGGGASAKQEMDAEERAKLEALGYVSGGGGGPHPDGAPDPKDRIEVLTTMVEGLGAFKARRFADAEAAYVRALRSDPGNAVLRKNLGRALAELGRGDEADAELGRAAALATGGLRADILAIKADGLMERGRAADAIRDARRALLDDPSLTRAAMTLARALEAEGDAPGAVDVLQTAWERQQSDVGLLLTLGEIEIRRGREAEARAVMEEALRRQPGHPMAHYDLGVLLLRAGQTAEGLAHLEQAGSARSQTGEGAIRMAQSLVEKERLSEAVAVLRGRLRTAPQEVEPRYTLAVLLSRLGSNDEAVAHLRDLSTIAPTKARVWNALGTALARRGNMAEALPCFTRAVELEPASGDYQENLRQAREAAVPGG